MSRAIEIAKSIPSFLGGNLSLDFVAQREAGLQTSKLIVSFFYYHLIFLSLLSFFWSESLFSRQNFSPLAPLFWTNLLDFPTSVNVIRFFFLASSLMGGMFFRRRPARFLAFLGVLQYQALWSSFGIQFHQLLPWLYVSFLFLFLPNIWQKDAPALEERKKFLLILWAAGALFLSTYFLSGFSKVYWSFVQIAQGEISSFSPEALARHAASESPRLGSGGALGSFFIEYPLLGWPLMLGALYLELFALWAAVKPSLHRLWAFGLILFHVGNYFIMNIIFFEPTLLLLVLFANSPFQKPDATWKDSVRDLPIFGWTIKYGSIFLRKRKNQL